MFFNREVFVIDILFVGNAHWDVFFSKNASDLVIESLRNVRDLEVWPFCVGRLRVSLRVLWSYLKIPCISERLNHRITNIFRKENIPVRIAQKFYTLRQAQRGEFHISHDTSRLISVFSPRWKERSRVSREIFNYLNFKMQLIQGKFRWALLIFGIWLIM